MKRNILITGSTDGIGKLTALKLAQEGHNVFVHGRNPEKVASVVAEIKASNPDIEVDGFVADLSDLAAVQALAIEIKAKLSGLDVLINNAGVYNTPETGNKDGLDMRFVVNHLAPIVLTEALIPLLQESKDARIVNLSSAAQSSVSIEALKGNARLSQGEAYAQSKLAFTMWSFQLAGQHKNISVLAVNPGSLLNTKMVKEAFGNHWGPVDKGADIVRALAVNENYRGVSGKYFDNDRGNFGKAHPDAYNEVLISGLRNTTEEILG